jgi:RNA polymerase sigma-70 factor (ECF subfamily)
MPGTRAEDGPDDVFQAALDALEPLLREALLLKYGEELAYEDMARVTGANVSALKMRVKRARDAVRPLLKDRLHE